MTHSKLVLFAVTLTIFFVAAAHASITINPGLDADDSVRIQTIIDNSTGDVHFAAGVYNLMGTVHLRGNRTYIGEGSWDSRYGSVLVQHTPGLPIFTVDGLIGSVSIVGLTFDSSPNIGGRGIAGSTAQAVLANSIIRDSYFLTGLSECIDVAMQATRIEHNSFGLNGGSIGPQHRHIHSVSAGAALETNANWIEGNHFSQATGTESVLFENGGKVHFVGNDFQGNAAQTTIRIHGMFQVVIEGNYFEQNAGAAQMTFGNSVFLLGNYIVRLENNFYHMGGYPGGPPTKFVFDVETSGTHRSFPGQTQVFMGYEAGSFFAPTADLTSAGVFLSCYLWITGPSRAFHLNGYAGLQTAGNPNCH
jgi:hypothetical protein